jgi:hypothetical protein
MILDYTFSRLRLFVMNVCLGGKDDLLLETVPVGVPMSEELAMKQLRMLNIVRIGIDVWRSNVPSAWVEKFDAGFNK